MKIGNIECYGVIYKITNLVNGKCYIGQSTRKFKERYNYNGSTLIERVFNYHKGRKENGYCYNAHLLSSIKHYGFDNFEVSEMIDIAFSREELDIKEMNYIRIYDSFENGYNYTLGGGGNKGINNFADKTEEEMIAIKEKMSLKAKGENNAMYGKNPLDYMTEEARLERGRKISEANKGRNPYTNKTEEEIEKMKKKMSEAKKGRSPWDNLTEEDKIIRSNKISKAKKGKYVGKDNPGSNVVMCITTNMVFYSTSEAAKYYGSHKSNIVECCNGNRKSAGKLSDGTKLVWRYLTIIEL